MYHLIYYINFNVSSYIRCPPGADWGLKLEGEFDEYTSPIAGGPARDNKLVWCIGKGPHKLKFKPFKANKYPSYYKFFSKCRK